MSVLQVSTQWTTPGSTAAAITDVVSISGRKGIDIQNNICEITVKNSNAYWIGTDGTLSFKHKDKFAVYAQLITDGANYGNATWQSASSFLGNYFLSEFGYPVTRQSQRIKLSTVDQAYILFNRIFTQEFGVSQSFTAPGMIRSVIRLNANTTDASNGFVGTDLDTGVYFSVDAKYTSEGGYIQDTRTTPVLTLSGAHSSSITTITVASTTGAQSPTGSIVIGTEHIAYTGVNATQFTGCTRGIDGTVAVAHSNGDTVYQGFPLVAMSKVWKPIYEWTTDLSQVNATNYGTEITAGTYFFQRAFMLWVDKNNYLNWLPADNTVDRNLVVGTDQITDLPLEQSVYDAVNYVIYNTGDDMYGNGITWYWYDPTTNISDFKMRYQPMTDISFIFLRDDRAINGTRNATPVDNIYKQFPTPGSYPLANWSFKVDSNAWRALDGSTARATIASDTEYNDSLREACKWRGRLKSQTITKKLFGLRYKGRIAVRGANYNPGDLIQLTNVNTGTVSQLVRVITVNFNISPGSYTTSLEVEEDDKTFASVLAAP